MAVRIELPETWQFLIVWKNGGKKKFSRLKIRRG